MDRKLQLLASVPLLARLERKDLEAIERLCDEVDVAAGKVVTSQGSYGAEFYIILDGSLAVTRNGDHLADLGTGAFFGELALLGKIQRTATVTATTPSRLLVLGSREFSTILRDHASIQAAVLHAVAERMARMEGEHPTH